MATNCADPREWLIDELIEVGKEVNNLVVLDADVSRTSRTRRFRDQYPTKFYDCGVAEQNMLGIAAGLATTGLIPLAVTFSVFASMRAAEQIRTSICYPNLNAKIIGGYAGLSNGKDGATHQSIEDIAITRSFPNLVVLAPADAMAAKKIIRAAIKHQGPVYLRVEYESLPLVYSEDFQFEIGRGYKVREGKDVTVLTYGSALIRVLEAAAVLSREGLEVEVIDLPTLKPLDREIILASVEKTGNLVTVEDHNVIGGLASAVCQILVENRVSVGYAGIAISDTFTESGTCEELRVKYGVGKEQIIEAIRGLHRKGDDRDE